LDRMLWRVDTSVMFPGLERNTRPFVWYLAACSATYVVAHIIARKMKAWRPKSDVVADADLIFSLPMYSWMSFLACKGTAEVWDAGWEEHWFGSGGNSRQFTLLYAAMNLVHLPITLLKKQSTTYKALMTFHHILSISCMMTGILLNRMYFWGAFDGICEISTFCLTTLFCLKEFGGSGPVSKMLITINGVSLWLTYLIFRIFLFPTWLYCYVTEVQQNPAQTFESISMFERYMYPVVNVFLFFLSSHWMMQITAGMMKQLRKASVKKAANGDAHAHGEKNNGITDTDATKDTCAVDGDSNANARKKKEQ